MTASGKIYPAEGTANNPLFAAQVPAPSTIAVKASGNIKAGQLLTISSSGAAVVIEVGVGKVYAVAANAAKQNEKVAVYMSGCFNVDALDVSAITAAAGKTGAELVDLFINAQSSGLQFVALTTDAAVPTV